MHDPLTLRVFVGIARTQAVLALMLFGPGWSLDYWQGWLLWLVFFACILAISIYLLAHDRALVRRRMKAGPTAERRPQQKLVQSVFVVLLVMLVIVSVLDHRFGWSAPGPAAATLGDGLIVIGFVIVFATFRANSFASAIVEVGPGQTVIDTGPYAVVRHPMYSGALLMFFGTPPALGSWWGLIPAALLSGALAWRLLDEEQFLVRELSGYGAYREKVHSRLLPGLW
jgi:protein-S-isoprenylcysteine O-methyltransferase Ste14